MLSQGDSAFAMLNSVNDFDVSKLWESKGISIQGIIQEDLINQQPEQENELYVTESSSLIANIVAKTYFTKRTEAKPSELKD
jgi:hypothetical protein